MPKRFSFCETTEQVSHVWLLDSLTVLRLWEAQRILTCIKQILDGRNCFKHYTGILSMTLQNNTIRYFYLHFKNGKMETQTLSNFCEVT